VLKIAIAALPQTYRSYKSGASGGILGSDIALLDSHRKRGDVPKRETPSAKRPGSSPGLDLERPTTSSPQR
jgi:hypothetical protein